MAWTRRSLRPIIRPKTKTLNEANPVDCRLFAYYLYEIIKYKHEFYSDDEDDDDFVFFSYFLFVKLAKKLGQEKAIGASLEKTIASFEKYGKLHVDEKIINRPFCGSEVLCKYKEDRNVENLCSNRFDKLSLIHVNMFRCLYVTQSNEYLLSLIANYLIRKTPSEDSSLLGKLPLTLKRALEDNSEVRFASEAVNLSSVEASFLALVFRLSTNIYCKSLMDTFSDACKDEILARILGIPNRSINLLKRKDSKLRLYGFIDEGGTLDDDFVECMNTHSMDLFFCDLLKKDDSESYYELESFNVDENTRNIMSRMLDGKEGLSILLYGKPGSGKTEFAKSLAKKSGLTPYIFKNESELLNGKNSSVLPRLNCLLSMASKDRVYIIDEADSILRTCDYSFLGMLSPSQNKGTVNKMLEENRNKIIWIVNFTSQMDESTLRRFTYSYRFESMSRQQLRTITESKLKPLELPLPVNNQILDLIEHYKVTGASVDNVVKTIRNLDDSSDKLVLSVKSVLKENALLLNGKSRMRESVSQNYDLSVLNASMNPEHIVKMVENARAYARESCGAKDSKNGIRMLFYGVSGTGKTEFARYIADRLGSKILLKRASDILSKWVGEAEQNIRDAFDEAERTDSILLFDEADSFFSDRKNSQHSWERTQVNEFLTQMEEFSGILICTTNLKNIMDPAMNRRFHIISEFKPLDSKGINTLLKRYFGRFSFDEENIRRLDRLSTVTPGDFGVLEGRIRFMDKDLCTESYIIEELCKIQEEKNGGEHHIGFAV